MTREKIIGVLLGVSVGVAIGYLLKPPETPAPRAPRNPADSGLYGPPPPVRSGEVPGDRPEIR